MKFFLVFLLTIGLLWMSAFEAYSQSETEWAQKGDVFLESEKYEDAVSAYINALLLNPRNEAVRNNLLKAEKHVEYSFIIDENQVEKTGTQYIQVFGDKGKYFNRVHHDLGMEFKTIAYGYRDKSEVSLMEDVYRRYKTALGKPSMDIEEYLSIAAVDSAVKATESKSWEAAIRYNTIVISNTRQRRDYEIAQERLAEAQKKVRRGLFGCTASSRQYIYSTGSDAVQITSTAPKQKRKNIIYEQNDKAVSVPLEDIILILDPNNIPPSMVVFNDNGKAFCSSSESSHLLNFPDHFSYRALTKKKEIITAGVAPYAPVVLERSTRKLVNDNINKVPIAEINTKDLVIEAYRYRRYPFGENYVINVHLPPDELALYRDEIISWMRREYLDLENIAEGTVAEGEVDNYDTDVVVDTTDQDVEINPELSAQSDDTETEMNAGVSDAGEDDDLAEVREAENPNLGKRIVPKLDDSISETERSEIQLQAEVKLQELESTFIKLTNRQLNSSQKQRVRESAVEELFINERASVSVSSLKSPVISFYPIPTYLLRLEKMISGIYQEVEIEFSEIHKVSNFSKNPDGTWTAIVTFTQKFKGFKDLDGKRLAYSDITQKNVVVKIRRVELFTGNSNPDVYWEVLLADIGVNQTEPFID